jgi:Ca2+/H+ antiporter
VTELLVSIFGVAHNKLQVVLQSLIGSVFGNLLFVLGSVFFVAGLKHGEDVVFDADAISDAVIMLILSLVGLTTPMVLITFGSTATTIAAENAEWLSFTVSVILLVFYLFSLLMDAKILNCGRGATTSDSNEEETKKEREALLSCLNIEASRLHANFDKSYSDLERDIQTALKREWLALSQEIETWFRPVKKAIPNWVRSWSIMRFEERRPNRMRASFCCGAC